MKAMYAGSFDPFTLGHLDIVKKALALETTEHFPKYDKLIICVGYNEAKTPLFSTKERKKFIKLAIADLHRAKDITVLISDELTVSIAQQNDVKVLIRGIRADYVDLYNERQMAEANRLLAAARGFQLETDFIIQDDPFLQIVSSSLVRSLLRMQEYIAISHCLPKCVADEIIAEKLKQTFEVLFTNDDVAEYYWEKVKNAYSPRPYHNLLHLAYMFNQLAIYEQSRNEKDTAIDANLHLAIFMHDYIHNTQPGDLPQHNEQDSAKTVYHWSKQQIFIPKINMLTVYRLIMATAHDQATLTNQQKLIADLDLSILGTTDDDVYNAYIQAIREEYIAYSDEEYQKGRLAFLFELLKKKHLFHTTFFRNRFEKQARRNITAEVKLLHGRS